MKIILAGYEGSKKILAASSFLVSKYLGPGFDVYWLNYGKYDGSLFAGQYIELDSEQKGGVGLWSKYLADYLEKINDDLVIFALDDYLLNSPVNIELYKKLLSFMERDDIICARLCSSDFYRDYQALGTGLILIDGNNEYSSTTQYCIWKRAFLIELLKQVRTPWEFELQGSRYLGQAGKKVVGSMVPAFYYYENSALSVKWGDRVKLDGIRAEDKDYVESLL